MRPGRSGTGDGWAVYDRLNRTVKGQERLAVAPVPDTIAVPGGLNGLLRQQWPLQWQQSALYQEGPRRQRTNPPITFEAVP